MDGELEPRESHFKGVGLGEWEAEEQLHAIDGGVGDLFGGSHKAEEVPQYFLHRLRAAKRQSFEAHKLMSAINMKGVCPLYQAPKT